MASYRPFPPPPQSTFAPAPLPNQNALQPPGPPQLAQGQGRGSQYPQNWGYGGNNSYSQMDPRSNYQHYNPSSAGNQIPPPSPPHQHQYAPPPPLLDSSYPPPPPLSMPSRPAPAPPMDYPTSQQYPQYGQQQPLQQLQPPPPPSSPPSSAVPPPPPPSSPPPPPSSAPPSALSKESRPTDEKGHSRDRRDSGWCDPGQSNHGAFSKQHKPPAPQGAAKKPNGPPGRVETEEERRLRKKREMEKQRQEEKHRQQLKESQSSVLQKSQMLSSGIKGHGSISGSHMGERRATSLLSGERIENRLKKPTTFLCKLK